MSKQEDILAAVKHISTETAVNNSVDLNNTLTKVLESPTPQNNTKVITDAGNNDDEEDEWPSYSIKFDYYHDHVSQIEEQQEQNTTAIYVPPETKKTNDFVESPIPFETEGPEKILEKYKIALTFLLHPKSPLFNGKYYSNLSIEDDKIIDTFQHECSMFNNTKDYDKLGNTNYWQERFQDLDSFYDAKYATNEHKKLYVLWMNWKNNSMDNEDEKEDIQEDNLENNFYINAQQSIRLDKSAVLFVKSTEDIFVDAVNSLKAYKSHKYFQNKENQNVNIKLENNYNELHKITNTKQMGKWLTKNQLLKLKITDEITNSNNCNAKPMYEWNWKELVSFIDDIEDIKYFSSVLYQYQISGRELCVMNVKHIQYLIECSMMNNNNFDINALNDIKVQCKQQNVEWHIVKDAQHIKIALDKVRVQSHIVSKHYLSTQIIKSAYTLFNNVKYQKEARKIYKLVKLLQVDKQFGPKFFWKMDMVYFNKIDNFLSVLMANYDLSELFQKCFPKFLSNQNNEINRFVNDNDNYYANHNIRKINGMKSKRLLYRNLSGDNSLYEDIQQDYLDKCVQLMCFQQITKFVHNLDRFFLKTFCVLLVSLLVGCIGINIWYFNSSLSQISEAMSLSLKVLGERTKNKMIYEFWKPQLFTNTAINAILNGILLDKEAADPSNTEYLTSYDYYIQQFSEHKNTEAIWSIWIYNNDTNGFIGAFKAIDDNSIIISVYNGTCQKQYYYNNETKSRDWNRVYNINCKYIPRSRPWYKLGSQMVNNASSWTDPYLFANGETVGTSLVTPIVDNGTLLIILCEMIPKTLSESLTDTFTSMPDGTILMMSTPNMDVIVSSIGDIDIQTENEHSQNILISDSINHLRYQRTIPGNNDIFEQNVIFNEYNKKNGYYYSIFPFTMLFIDFFSTNPSDNILPDNYQNGFVIIANDSSYLDLYNMATNITNIVLIVMIIIGFINICYQSEHYKHKHKGPTRAQLIRINHGKNKIALRLLSTSVEGGSSFSLRQPSVENDSKNDIQTENKEEKQEFGDKNDSETNIVIHKKKLSSVLCCSYIHCGTGSLLAFTLCQIILTLLIISITWEYSDSETKNRLLEDIIPKHEFNEIADEVYYMFEISDMVEKQMAQNYEQMSLSNDSNAMDMWIINMMNSYIRPNSAFTPFMIYYGTPEGRFLGTIRVPNTTGLQQLRRDESTGFDRPFFNVIEGNIVDYDDMLGTQDLYDPRCRPWYIAALDKSYSGTMNTAYPDESFKRFIYDNKPPSLTQNCDTAKKEAMDLYGINIDNSYNFTNMTASKFVNNDKYSLVWSRYVFAELTTIGLTASTTVTNKNGEILAVIAIDWVLDSLSQLLVSAVDANKNNTIKEYSWIFEANTDDAAMIASSDMITITDTSQLEGCLTFSGGIDAEQIPFIASQHPQYDILVMSKEIINVHGINTIPINSRISQSVTVPLGLPHLEAGRISYYDKSENFSTINVDWIICRTVDFSKMEVQDIRFTIMLDASIIFAVVLILKRIANNQSSNSSDNDILDDDDDDDELNQDDEEEHYFKIMYKMKPIIMNSANAIWYRQYGTNNNLMTTEMTKDFCANRANLFITQTEDKYLFLKCIWECPLYYAPEKIIFHDIVESNLYSLYVLFVVVIHLILSLMEVQYVLPGLIICVILEYIDFIFLFSKKYIEFSLDQEDLIKLFEITRGFKHKYVDDIKHKYNNGLMSSVYRTLYLIFCGPDSNKIIVHVILLILILFDLILISAAEIYTFAFWIPILPLLLILRNDQIYNFGTEFTYALWKSKNVLGSYAFFIFMVSILTISLFGFMTNKDANNSSHLINSFYSIGEAIVTSFIYMSTAENYNLVYDMFDNDYYKNNPILLAFSLSFLILVGLLGTFCFIPLIIHQFEFAFNELEIKHAKKETFQRTICIIASFIMLDMNNDQGIDHEELKALVSKSILSDKKSVFNVFDHEDEEDNDEDEDDDIDLVGFVNYLLAQEFKNSITKTHSAQNKLQSYLECNIIRQPQYNTMILIMLVMPAYIFSVLKGLNSFGDVSIDYILTVLFACNFIEINIRWFSWGFTRYWDVKSSPNPHYVMAAINKYYNTQATITETSATNTETNGESLHLSAHEIQWASNNLCEARPLSIEEKAILTLTHRIELVIIYFSIFTYLIINFVYFTQNDITEYDENNRSFSIYFVQFGILLRTFTLLKSNQILTFSVFTVFPQFVSLIIFLFLYIYWWARLGTILFGQNVTDIVIAEVYDVAPGIAANFNSSGYAILCLIQLLFGEGWHEIMYVQALATTMRLTMYFIIYITVVTIIVSNIFVGLFLAGIDDLDKSHKQQKDLKKMQKCLKSKKLFNKYAHKKIKTIQYQLKQNEMNTKTLNKQLNKLHRLLKQVNGKDFKLPKNKSIE